MELDTLAFYCIKSRFVLHSYAKLVFYFEIRKKFMIFFLFFA